ncbi:MAG: competence protein ComEA [Methylomonas sp.]|jgi:competence protein ComEA|nr:MAG: competence protein ComEA [Methylomonas sp.]
MKMIFTILALISANVLAAPVNINQADAETISEALNGIGPKKAEAIVQYRMKNGPFTALSELEKVPGIGEKTIQINEKDIILTDSPAEAAKENPKDGASVKKSK